MKGLLLILEDHRDSAEYLAIVLRRNGYAVELASSIEEALRRCRSSTFDLILADLTLPDGDSRDLMPTLRRECGLCGIAVTGHGFQKDVEGCLAAGFDAVITKPYQWKDLKTAIEDVLSQPKLAPVERWTGSVEPATTDGKQP